MAASSLENARSFPASPALISAPLMTKPKSGEPWLEPSHTLFQLKRYAKHASVRAASRTPLWATVALSILFGFVAVSGGVLLYRLLF
jgi:hypothetical protein